jgi:hypothetical protein
MGTFCGMSVALPSGVETGIGGTPGQIHNVDRVGSRFNDISFGHASALPSGQMSTIKSI